ncbi:hypothetical protein ACH5RR_035212 [Cinchona calisaya]|uniref:Uncharacterized protein n=1 Tax=Cinchona calisaya TaxID=153742 RepID=A0ABD2YD70_9GENT
MEGRVENNHTNIKPFANLNSKDCVIMDQNCSENPLFGVEGIPEYGLVLDGMNPSILFQVGCKDMVFFDRVVDLVGFIGLNRYPEEEMDQRLVDLQDFDGFDSKGLKLNLGLQPTQNQLTFVVINGVDYVTGWINPLDSQQMPTLLKKLENKISMLICGMSSFGPNISPGPGPVSLLPPRDPFADSNFRIGGSDVKVNSLSIPKTLKIKPVDLPCLLCYSNRNWVGNYELYIPVIRRAFSPPLSINFSQYLMVAQNYNSCEFLLFDVNANEVVVYRGLDDEVVTFPTLTLYAKYGDLISLFGWFERVAGEYYVLIVSLQALTILERTCLSFYWKHPSEVEWDSRHHHFFSYHVQRPMAPMATKVTWLMDEFFGDELFEDELFAWVDASVGMVFTVTDWRRNYPRIGPSFDGPFFQDAGVIYSVNDGNRLCLVVYRNATYLVVDVRFNYDEDHNLEIDYIPRANLNDRNFYCSYNVFGFSADPFIYSARPINCIYIGGWIGNCCVINNFIEMAAGFAAECVQKLPSAAEVFVFLCTRKHQISPDKHRFKASFVIKRSDLGCELDERKRELGRRFLGPLLEFLFNSCVADDIDAEREINLLLRDEAWLRWERGGGPLSSLSSTWLPAIGPSNIAPDQLPPVLRHTSCLLPSNRIHKICQRRIANEG